MSKEYSAEIANALISYIKKEGYTFDFDQEKGIITFALTTESSFSVLHFSIHVRKLDFVSYARIDMMAKEAYRLEVAEFLTRVNYGLPYGCMELDMRDGEIRCRVTIVAGDGPLNDLMIEPCIGFPVCAFDTYGDELFKVMLGATTAEDAIEAIEQSESEDEGGESAESASALNEELQSAEPEVE